MTGGTCNTIYCHADFKTREKIEFIDGIDSVDIWHIAPMPRGSLSECLQDLNPEAVENLAASLWAWLEDYYRRHEEQEAAR